jgi:hypothetical protein
MLFIKVILLCIVTSSSCLLVLRKSTYLVLCKGFRIITISTCHTCTYMNINVTVCMHNTYNLEALRSSFIKDYNHTPKYLTNALFDMYSTYFVGVVVTPHNGMSTDERSRLRNQNRNRKEQILPSVILSYFLSFPRSSFLLLLSLQCFLLLLSFAS